MGMATCAICGKEATRLYEKTWVRWNIRIDGTYVKAKKDLGFEVGPEDRFHLCNEHGDKYEKGVLHYKGGVLSE